MEVEQTTAIRYICFFLYNLFAHLANLYYLCCEKPKTGRVKVLKPSPFSVFLLLLCSRCGAAFRFSDGTTIPPAPFCTKTPFVSRCASAAWFAPHAARLLSLPRRCLAGVACSSSSMILLFIHKLHIVCAYIEYSER